MSTSITEYGTDDATLVLPHRVILSFPKVPSSLSLLLLSAWQASFSPSSRVSLMAHNFPEFSWHCLYFPLVSICHSQFFSLRSWERCHFWPQGFGRDGTVIRFAVPLEGSVVFSGAHHCISLVFSFHKAAWCILAWASVDLPLWAWLRFLNLCAGLCPLPNLGSLRPLLF